MHGSDGGVLWGSHSWPATRSAGACCPVDVPRVCATLCQGSEERRTRCGSDCGSSDTADHAVCRDQERGAARSSVTASRPRALGRGADSTHFNQLRALMLERGIAVPQGRCKLARYLPEILADERNGLGPRLRQLIEDIREEWRSIDPRIKGYDDELAEQVRNEDTAKRLISIPGIGVLT